MPATSWRRGAQLQAEALRSLIDNSRRLRELTSELAALALQQVKNDPAQPDL